MRHRIKSAGFNPPFDIQESPFPERLDVSRLPTLELPDAVLFPNEVVRLAVGRTDPLVRTLEQAGDSPFKSKLVKFGSGFDQPPNDDGGMPGRICTLGRARFSPRSGLLVLPFARVFSDRTGDLPRRNPAYPVFGACASYPEVRGRLAKLIRRSPGIDADAGVDILDHLEAIEQLKERGALPVDIAADFIAVCLIRRIADLDVPVRLQRRWLEMLDPAERVRALNAFMVEVLDGALTPDKKYGRALKARKEHCARLLSTRSNDTLASEFLEARLRDADEQLDDPIASLRGKLAACGMSGEARARLQPEIDGLSTNTDAKTLEYFRRLAELPWRGGGMEEIVVDRARRLLDERHVGLGDAKNRILEYLAVRRRTGDAREPVLCLVGPPGVGKTSLAGSIARALGREFTELSCNALNEVTDVRGARRDWAASEPGRIIRQLRGVGARNPVFVLDEIDKVGWNAGRALLDVLEPGRNAAFHDLYVDVPFDLSEVFFIATANVLDRIPGPLRDRLEVIEIAGYSEAEKLEIARRILVPTLAADHGLSNGLIEFEDGALRALVRDHANDMGVRDVVRGVSAICRWVALGLETPDSGSPSTVTVRENTVREVLGAPAGHGGGLPGVEGLRAKIERGGLPPAARCHAANELQLMLSKSPGDAEYGDRFTYLQKLTGLPWTTRDEERIDLARTRALLDERHWGLAKAKVRILEHLAVRKLGGGRGAALCLVGPPGVGKTSLARDVAEAMGRKFASISCAGLSDGTELRGHNRTWRAAEPGRIVRELIRVGAKNPVFMLDEIDKISRVPNSGGDPESALLEVLDPTQNDTFVDNYVAVPFDLSEVFFVATANVLDAVAVPLRDRLEVIELPGYSEDEKFEIARAHLVGRQVAEHGLPAGQVAFTDAALHALIRGYTREAGVRGLARSIGDVCRKVALRRAEGDQAPTQITGQTVADLLGAPPHADEVVSGRLRRPGVAMGLSTTPAGGDVSFVEARRMPGAGLLTLTGQLGSVMKESARAALSWLRANASRYGVDPEFYGTAEMHLHVPAGATPKDGPSAGVAMAAALASELTGRAVRDDRAMTGEITLSGDVLPVGGVKEKVLAARRLGIAEVILPKRNAKDVDEHLGGDRLRGIGVRYVSTIDEVLELALSPPTTRGAKSAVTGRTRSARRGSASGLEPMPSTDSTVS